MVRWNFEPPTEATFSSQTFDYTSKSPHYNLAMNLSRDNLTTPSKVQGFTSRQSIQPHFLPVLLEDPGLRLDPSVNTRSLMPMS